MPASSIYSSGSSTQYAPIPPPEQQRKTNITYQLFLQLLNLNHPPKPKPENKTDIPLRLPPALENTPLSPPLRPKPPPPDPTTSASDVDKTAAATTTHPNTRNLAAVDIQYTGWEANTEIGIWGCLCYAV